MLCQILTIFFKSWITGEVSDSDISSDEDVPFEFNDGLGDDLIGDEKDRERLEKMTEKEREQEIFNRVERREMLRTRYLNLFQYKHGLCCFKYMFVAL